MNNTIQYKYNIIQTTYNNILSSDTQGSFNGYTSTITLTTSYVPSDSTHVKLGISANASEEGELIKLTDGYTITVSTIGDKRFKLKYENCEEDTIPVSSVVNMLEIEISSSAIKLTVSFIVGIVLKKKYFHTY